LMFGEAASGFSLTLIDNYRGLLLAILPPGAFIGLGFLIAIKNVIDNRRRAHEPRTIPINAEPASLS